MVYDRVFVLLATGIFGMIELEDAIKQSPARSLMIVCKAINVEASGHLKLSSSATHTVMACYSCSRTSPSARAMQSAIYVSQDLRTTSDAALIFCWKTPALEALGMYVHSGRHSDAVFGVEMSGESTVPAGVLRRRA